MTSHTPADREPNGGTIQRSIGPEPADRWQACEAVESDSAIIAMAGERCARLLADGIRELLMNASLHGNHLKPESELVIDLRRAMVTLRIPGEEFDSVSAAAKPENRWLSRFGRMLVEDGVSWRWWRDRDHNVLEFRLTSTRACEGGSA